MSESRPVANALQLLEALSESKAMSLADLSRRCRVPKPTALRYLRELTLQGYASRDERQGTYMLGAKVLELARSYRAQFDPLSIARSTIRELADLTGETAHLAILSDRSIVFIDIAESKQTLRAFVAIGEQLPVHCVASGIAILAHSESAVIKRVLEKPLQRFTSRTITSRSELMREIAAVKRNGFALADRLWKDDVVGISAPILASDKGVIGAIGVSLPKSRSTAKGVLALGRRVQAFAEKASR